MEKQILSCETYLALADEFNISHTEFINQYLPVLVKCVNSNINFTSIGLDTIEILPDVVFPTAPELKPFVIEAQQQFTRDYGVFERTYESGQLVRESYSLPAMRQEAQELVSKLPQDLDLTNAFSIGMRPAGGPYDTDYITVYFTGDYQQKGTVSYGMKFDANTGVIFDTKLLYEQVPLKYQNHIPENTTKLLFGEFTSDDTVVDLYFAFSTEAEYESYLGNDYVKPPISSLGLGMIGLTINTTDNVVNRIKRYTF